MKIQDKSLGDVLLPDFLLVGAAKSATSSLHAYLDQHPDIMMPAIKENWFFSFVNNPPHYESPGVLNDVVSRLEDYSGLFQGARPGQRLGDASPSYLYTYRDSIRNIKSIYSAEELENLRIIISLRNPVDRAFSQYWTFKRRMQEPLQFDEAVDEITIRERLSSNWNIFYDYIGFGNYYEPVKAYMEAFGKEKVFILLYDDIKKDSLGVCQSIYTFLDVDSSFVPTVGIKHNAKTGEPKLRWLMRILNSRNPVKRAIANCVPKRHKQIIGGFIGKHLLRRTKMDETTRRKLTAIFAEDIKQLEVLINRDLSHWRSDD